MLIALSIAILLLSFAVFPFMFTVRVSADAFAGSGKMKIEVFSLPLFKADLRLENMGPTEKNIIITKGNKQSEIHLNMNKDDKKSIMVLLKSAPIASYLIWERLCINADIGLAENAFATTVTVGGMRILMGSFGAFLKNRQHIALCGEIEPTFGHNELTFEIYGIIRLSVANIISSILAGWKNKLGVRSKHNGKIKARRKVIA